MQEGVFISVFEGIIVPTEMLLWEQFFPPAPHSKKNGACVEEYLLNITFTNDIFF